MSEYQRLVHKGIVKPEESLIPHVERSKNWLQVLPYQEVEHLPDFKKTTRRKSKSGNSKNIVFATYGNYSHIIGFNANYREAYDIPCDRRANRHYSLPDLELFRLAVLHDVCIDNMNRSEILAVLERHICTDCLGKFHS